MMGDCMAPVRCSTGLPRKSQGYWRWHGSPRIYYDGYDENRLQVLARALAVAASRNRVAWCIFDNTAAGHAIPNALRLQQLVAAGTQSVRKAPQP